MSKEISSEKVTEYMMSNLLKRPSLDVISKDFGYSRNYFARKFTEMYGVPYTRYLTGLLMRDAAEKLIQGAAPIHDIAVMYGFASSYQFSRAFKREIGESPRLFLKGDRRIPDIPPRKDIYGKKLFLNYVKTDDSVVTGYPVKTLHGIKTDLLKECAYHMDHSDPDFDKVVYDEKVAFWWGNNAEDMYYVLGTFNYSRRELQTGEQSFDIPGTSYAVFSIERMGDDSEDLAAHREMVRYVMKDWVWINKKSPDRMYYTYEVFDKAYTYLYLPLQEDTISSGLLSYMKELNIDNWISYIDSRIEDDISVQEIAAHFHYSETHFRRVFKLYFEMAPQAYIRKRRLYLAAAELSMAKGNKKRESIAEKYYFHTSEYFNRLFIKEFHMKPEDYRNVRIRAINLAEYYTAQKDSVSVKFRYIDGDEIVGFILVTKAKEIWKDTREEKGDEKQEDFDIPELVTYWMTHDPDDIRGTEIEQPAGKENKIAIWYYDKDSMGYEYLVGYPVDNGFDIPAGYRRIVIDKGKYAVFESLQKSDRDNLIDTYRMLMRCSFYGWIKENRYRVDFGRPTFVRFAEDKLYFYIPINE